MSKLALQTGFYRIGAKRFLVPNVCKYGDEYIDFISKTIIQPKLKTTVTLYYRLHVKAKSETEKGLTCNPSRLLHHHFQFSQIDAATVQIEVAQGDLDAAAL